MDADYVRERITELRIQKGVSEYKMSYDLGHCRGYVNNISSGKSLPSMTEFFAICDYFSITPVEFFDYQVRNPNKMNELLGLLARLDQEELELIRHLVDRLLQKQ